jgi:hypothetical protein
MALLDSSGKKATDPQKLLGTLDSSETTRDLLLDLDHPKISLSLVVCKGSIMAQKE